MCLNVRGLDCLGLKLGFSIDHGNLHNISLGQGQESIAEKAVQMAATKGHWVILQVLKTLISNFSNVLIFMVAPINVAD